MKGGKEKQGGGEKKERGAGWGSGPPELGGRKGEEREHVMNE